MIESISAGLGGKLADRLAVMLLSPAFGCWALGCGAWIWTRPRPADHAVSRLAALRLRVGVVPDQDDPGAPRVRSVAVTSAA